MSDGSEKSPPKLRLQKETIRELSEKELDLGGGTGGVCCFTDCGSGCTYCCPTKYSECGSCYVCTTN